MEALPESPAAEQYDRAKEVEEFQETRAGVKGLVDSGNLSKIPRMFIHEAQHLPKRLSFGSSTTNNNLKVPVIDLKGLECGRRKEIVDEIREASKTWGIFQMINHGIPTSLMDELLESQKRFHDQPKKLKMELYSQDPMRKVRFYSNGIVDSRPANWRDTVVCSFPDESLEPEAIPILFRTEIVEYVKSMMKLRDMLSELLSEALGLSSDYFKRIECMKSVALVCNYYPPCPEPHLTLGISKHADPGFLTILLQDSLSALQVLHQNQWVDVPPTKGALIANLGDLMQLITNDKFKSVEHRALANSTGPRLSVACFFNPSAENISKLYGPIKEILSDSDPPIYREAAFTEYMAHYRSKGLDGTSALSYFKT